MIIFLSGGDLNALNQKLQELKSQFQEKNKGENLSFFQIETNDEGFLNNFRSVLESDSLFGGKKFITVKQPVALGEFNEVVDLLKKFSKEKNTVILFWQLGEFKDNTLFKFLEKNSDFKYNFNIPEKKGLKPKILSILKKYDKKITDKALDYLLSLPNEGSAINELNKIIFYPESTINEDIVKNLIPVSFQSQIFDFIDALSQGHKNKALLLLENEYKSGIDPLKILSLLVYQFRAIFQILDGSEKGLHPYSAAKIRRIIKFYNRENVAKVLKKLSSIDIKIKKGEPDPRLALEFFVLNYSPK